jgi:hypothetical protein
MSEPAHVPTTAKGPAASDRREPRWLEAVTRARQILCASGWLGESNLIDGRPKRSVFETYSWKLAVGTNAAMLLVIALFWPWIHEGQGTHAPWILFASMSCWNWTFALMGRGRREASMRTVYRATAVAAGLSLVICEAMTLLLGDVHSDATALEAGFAVLYALMPWLMVRQRMGVWLRDQQRIAAERALAERHREDRERREHELVQSRLQLVRARVEPRFVRDVLEHVHDLIPRDRAAARAATAALSAYLRHAMSERSGEVSTLGRELDLVRAYLDLQASRLHGHLAYAIDAEPALRDVAFPSLVLVALVDSAVKYGIEPAARMGRITVIAGRDGEDLVVRIGDDGLDFAQRESSPAYDVARGRIAAQCGKGAVLGVATRPPCGVVVTISMPLLVREAAHA